jgi:hypothetical protein
MAKTNDLDAGLKASTTQNRRKRDFFNSLLSRALTQNIRQSGFFSKGSSPALKADS